MSFLYWQRRKETLSSKSRESTLSMLSTDTLRGHELLAEMHDRVVLLVEEMLRERDRASQYLHPFVQFKSFDLDCSHPPPPKTKVALQLVSCSFLTPVTPPSWDKILCSAILKHLMYFITTVGPADFRITNTNNRISVKYIFNKKFPFIWQWSTLLFHLNWKYSCGLLWTTLSPHVRFS